MQMLRYRLFTTMRGLRIHLRLTFLLHLQRLLGAGHLLVCSLLRPYLLIRLNCRLRMRVLQCKSVRLGRAILCDSILLRITNLLHRRVLLFGRCLSYLICRS